MDKLYKTALTFLVAFTLILSGGCANSPYVMPDFENPFSPATNTQTDPRLTNNDEARFFSKSGLEACVGGALIGVVGCKLSNAKNEKACMLKAALIGCGVGMGANYYLDQRRSEYSNQQQRLDAMLADVEADNRRLQSLNQTARSVIADDRTALTQIKKDIAQKKVDTVAAQKRLTEVDSNIAFLQKTLTELKKRQQEWREVAKSEKDTGGNVAKLDTEIKSMESQIASLQSEIDDLFEQRTAIKLG